ncbi:hypothetical protein V499_00312 [Pseudogymnoascus sp. VKM F-103]|nr:hypothetical protein V499_00312 [Pseudogymnoascus sp. VKM F-103]
MQFQYVLLAILAATTQVLAVPTTEAKPATELVAVAEGTRVTAATPKGDNDVVADSTSYPFYSYSALGFWTAANRGQDATHADTPAQGIIAATHIPCVTPNQSTTLHEFEMDQKPVWNHEKLAGKSNWASWYRNFSRVTKDEDVYDLLSRKTRAIATEPLEENCIVFTDAESKIVDAPRSLLKWQAEYRRWEKSRIWMSKARKLTMMSVSDGIAVEIDQIDNPIQMIQYLIDTYRVSSERAREDILERIGVLKLENFASMTDFLNKHREYRQDLLTAKHLYTDGQFVTNVLIGLPSVYHDFKRQYDWIRAKEGDGKHDLLFLYDRLLLEEEDQKRYGKTKSSNEKKSTQHTPSKDKPKNNKTCSYEACGKNGHTADECWRKNPDLMPEKIKKAIEKKKQEKQQDSNKKPDKVAAHVSLFSAHVTQEGADGWLADTGTNSHVCNNKSMFTTFTPAKMLLHTADGKSSMEILGTGSVTIDILNEDGNPTTFTFSEVVFSPSARANLLSISELAKKADITSIFNSQGMTFQTKDGFQVGRALLKNGLYFVDCSWRSPEDTYNTQHQTTANLVEFDDPVWKWHRRLGHLGIQNMRTLLKRSQGMDLTDKQLKDKLGQICPICATSKALVTIPREPARRRSTEPGKLIHVDTWGPYSIIGLDGEQRGMFFTDDATRYTWADLYSTSTELPPLFKKRHKAIEKAYGFTIRAYRLDGEFHQGKIARFLQKKNTRLEKTVPYMHYMNGTAERTNRTLREKAAPMLQELSLSGQLSHIIREKGSELLRNTTLPEKLWPYAIRQAVWHKNRSPTRALKDQLTPWEALLKNTPSLQKEHIWASRVYVTIETSDPKRVAQPKLHTPRGWMGYFVGCDSESVYLIYSPDKDRVFRVGIARVEEGVGIDDPHRFPSRSDRVSSPESQDQGEKESIYSGTDEHSINTVEDQDMLIATSETPNYLSDGTETSEQFFSQHGSDYEEEADLLQKDDMQQSLVQDTAWSDESDSEPLVHSKYFAALAHQDGSSSETTKKNSRLQVKTPLLMAHQFNPKCRRCYRNGAKCFKIQGYENCCRACYINRKVNKVFSIPLHSPCNFNCDGVTPKKAYVTKKLPAQVGLDRCRRCTKTRNRCTGGIPCNQCQKHQIRCIRMGDLDKPRCNRCQHGPKACNRSRPCNVCVKRNFTCVYTEQNGLVKRFYYPKSSRHHNGQEDDEDEDEDECMRCKRTKSNCGGGRPCRKCVQVFLNRKNKRITSLCTWSTGNGNKESYLLQHHRIDDEGRVILVEDWETRQHIRDISSPRLLQKSGKWTVIPTPGDGALCGLYAIIYSLAAQLPTIVLPTIQDLQEIHRNGTLAQLNSDAALSNTNNFSADQLTAIAYQWGLQQGQNIQLGVVVEGAEEMIMQTPTGMQEDVHMLWIHNNNAIVLGQVHEESGMNHYSGLRLTALPRFKTTKADDCQKDSSSSSSDYTSDDSTESDENESPQIDNDVAFFTNLTTEKHAMVVKKKAFTSPEPLNYNEAMRSNEASEWISAMAVEQASIEENGVFEYVDMIPGTKPLRSRFVYKKKYGADGLLHKYKARLVARGDQQREGIDYDEIFATVVKGSSWKVLLAISASLGWKVHLMDVVTAFLNSELSEPKIFLYPPQGMQGVPTGKVMLLRKAIYGLKQSPRAWYEKFRSQMVIWGWRVSSFDSCVFIQDQRKLIVAIWVDDNLILGADEKEIFQFKNELSQHFKMVDDGLCKFYLGMNVQQRSDGIHIYQKKYADQILSRYGMLDVQHTKLPANPNRLLALNTKEATTDFTSMYRSKVGSLVHLANCTRPDMAHAIGVAGRYNANPSQAHMDATDQIYAFLNGTVDQGLFYKANSTLELVGYVDADHANCHDTRKSTTGFVFLLGGSPVSWCSQRQKTVAVSTTDAEYIAASEASREAIWLRRFINDLKIDGCYIPHVPLYIDNNAALKLTKNPEGHGRTKHIDIKYHYIRQKVEEGDIQTLRVDTKDNLADILTKALGGQKFLDFVKRLGLRSQSTKL